MTLVLVWQLGCAGPVKGVFPPAAGEPHKTVHVIRHGWHVGIAVHRADVPPDVLPVIRDFPKADYVEFGWGDDAYYRSPHPTKGMMLKAALWPTPSVLHVAGLQGTPREVFPASDIVEVELSEQGWDRMAGFIDKTFARDADGRLQPLERGLYGDSRFYRALGKFYFPRMCNMWSASALRKAGCPITPFYAVTAANLMWQTRRFGRTVELPDAPEAPGKR